MRALVHPHPAGIPSPGTVRDLGDDDLIRFYAPPLGSRATDPDGAPGDGLWVRFNFVTSADGAATVRGRSGGLGSDADRRLFALLRRPADVLLIGAGTIRTEGYGGSLLSDADRAWRTAAGLPAYPEVAAVTGTLDLDPQGEFLASAPARPLLLTTERALAGLDAGRFRALESVADLVACGERTAEPARIRAELAARGHRLVHSEGGPSLFGTFLAAGLADELDLSHSALIVGGSTVDPADPTTTPHPRIAAGPALAEPSRLRLLGLLEEDGDLFLRYAVAPPARPEEHA